MPSVKDVMTSKMPAKECYMEVEASSAYLGASQGLHRIEGHWRGGTSARYQRELRKREVVNESNG